MSKTVFIKSHKLIVIFFLIVNCAITVAVKSDPTQTIKSKHGFFANEMFCGDRNYPIPTMTKGDRDFTKDCYKIGSFTNMESLFNSKKILKSEKLYSLEYANIANNRAENSYLPFRP